MASENEIVEEDNRQDPVNEEVKTEGVEAEEIKQEEHTEQGKADKGKEGEDVEKDKEDTEMADADVSPEKEEGSEEEPEDESKKLDGDDEIDDSSDKGEEVGSKEKSESSVKGSVTPKERPARERKTVERYSESSTGRASSSSKTLSIGKGKGAQLKDIPNVAFKLSKRKPDDNLQILHTLLFGKKAKAHHLKKNIGQFSGYVWVENEERQRVKTKEKLDKCVKEKLLDFCDFLNIPINKAAVKKEELSAKLLEFLESPHATTDSFLADKEKKGLKRGGKATASKISSPIEAAGETQKRRKSSQVGEKHKRSSKDKKEDIADSKAEQLDSEDDLPVSDDEGNAAAEVESDKEIKSEEIKEEDELKKQKPGQKSSSKMSSKEDSQGKSAVKSISIKKGGPAKSVKSPKKPTEKSSSLTPKKDAVTAEDPSDSTTKSKVSSTKKQKVEKEKKNYKSSSVEGKAISKKRSSKTKMDLAKDQGKKSNKKAKVEPSKEEIHAVVVDILKEVDFNTATLSDILRQLGSHFGMDLMHRKAEIKVIITDVINSMTDDEDDEEGEDGEDTVKTGDDDKEA